MLLVWRFFFWSREIRPHRTQRSNSIRSIDVGKSVVNSIFIHFATFALLAAGGFVALAAGGRRFALRFFLSSRRRSSSLSAFAVARSGSHTHISRTFLHLCQRRRARFTVGSASASALVSRENIAAATLDMSEVVDDVDGDGGTRRSSAESSAAKASGNERARRNSFVLVLKQNFERNTYCLGA